MKVEARVFRIKEVKNKAVAMAQLVFEGQFVVGGIRIVEGQNGPFVSYPQMKNAKGEYNDLAHPITREGNAALAKIILKKYAECKKKWDAAEGAFQDVSTGEDVFIDVAEGEDAGLPFE